MSEVINLTPHDVNIVRDGVVVKTYPAHGNVARVSTSAETVSTVDDVEVVVTTFGDVEGIPEEKPGTYYIVSALVRTALNRGDLVSPDTGPASVVRDEQGHIVGVQRFTV